MLSAVALVGVAAVGGPAAPALGQGEAPPGRAPFPADRVALIPAADPTVDGGAVPPYRAMTDLYVSLGTDRSVPDVAVRFADGFAPPPGGYQVSVIVGEPRGEQLAASLTLDGTAAPGTAPVGRLSRFDGRSWRSAGATTAALDRLGYALIGFPLSAAPTGSAVWVEIAEGSPLVPTRTSPYFSRAALFGADAPGTLSASPLGQARDEVGRVSGPSVALGSSSGLAVEGDRMSLRAGEVPAEVGGQGVVGIVDRIRLVDGYRSRRPEREIRVDWTARTVDLVEHGAGGPQDRSGDRAWLQRGFPGDGSRPDSIDVDLDALARVLDADLASSRVAVGLVRSIRLADGRLVTTEGVMATVGSLRAVPARAAGGGGRSGATPPAGRTSEAPIVAIVSGAAVVLLVGSIAALSLMGQPRRSRRPESAPPPLPPPPDATTDRVPWDADAGVVTADAEREGYRVVGATLDTVPGDAAPGPDGPDAASGGAVAPGEVLARLDLEVSDLRSRLSES